MKKTSNFKKWNCTLVEEKKKRVAFGFIGSSIDKCLVCSLSCNEDWDLGDF